MAYLFQYWPTLFRTHLKGEWLQPPTSNARLLVSRNKREGFYGGCFASGRAGKSKPDFVRTRHGSLCNPGKLSVMLREP